MIGVTRPRPMPSVIESPGVDLASPCLNSSYIAEPVRIGAGGDDVLVLLLQISRWCRPACRRCRPTQMKPSTLPPVCSQISGPVEFVMRLGVVEIVPLVGKQHAVRLGLAQAARPAVARHAGNCSDWSRAAPAPRPVRRRTAAACPSFPGSGFPESRSRCGNRARWRPPQARCRYCRRSTSTTRPPGLRSPRFSASRIIHLPARSLTDWPGFMNSALPRMVQPVCSDARFSLISGVLPIASTTSLLMFICGNLARPLPDQATTLESRAAPSGSRLLRPRCALHGPISTLANTTWRTSIFPDRKPASQ